MCNARFNSSTTNYLLKYDLISKYNLTSIYCCPRINKIKLQISLKKFLSSSNFLNKVNFNANIQLKIILLYYLIFSIVPIVNFFNLKKNRFSKTKDNGDFLIELTLSDKKMIDSLLFLLLIENNNKILNFSKDFCFLKFNKVNKNWSYNFKIFGSQFKNVNDYFLNILKDINLSKLPINVNIIFFNLVKNKNLTKLIQNVLVIK